MKKKIVHLISSLKIGGAESLLYDLVLGLGSDEYEHHVIYFHGGPNVERLQGLGVSVYHVRGLVSLYDPIFFWRVWRLIASLKPDVIHTALWAANFVGRIIGYVQHIPTVCAVHLGVNLDGMIRNSLDALTFRLATHVIAVSDDVAQSVKDQGLLVPSQTLSVIKNGINAQAITQRALIQTSKREDLGLTSEHCVIGSVGRFIARKNFDLLIESFALLNTRYPHTRLVLVGLGEQEALLRKKAQTLGVEKEVIFEVGKSAYGYYPLFDIFVLPSAQEGLSIALLEAMSLQLPCIVTAHGTHEVVQSGYNGLVVEPNNSRLLYNALEEFVAMGNLRGVLGKCAGKTVHEQFSFEKMVNAYSAVFKNLSKC